MTNAHNSKDVCPAWASEAIEQLRQIEIYLGNIPSQQAWQSQHLDHVSKRTFSKGEQIFDEEKAEFVFKKIVRGLHHDGFSTRKIVEFINARVGYQGGPPYCNEAEVEAVVQHKD